MRGRIECGNGEVEGEDGALPPEDPPGGPLACAVTGERDIAPKICDNCMVPLMGNMAGDKLCNIAADATVAAAPGCCMPRIPLLPLPVVAIGLCIGPGLAGRLLVTAVRGTAAGEAARPGARLAGEDGGIGRTRGGVAVARTCGERGRGSIGGSSARREELGRQLPDDRCQARHVENTCGALGVGDVERFAAHPQEDRQADESADDQTLHPISDEGAGCGAVESKFRLDAERMKNIEG